MQPLSQVVSLNNEGVRFLLQQRHKEAIHRFVSALSLVKKLLAHQPTRRSNDHDPPPHFIHDSTCVIPGLQDINCFVFANAITLSPPTISNCPISESIANEMSSVVLLNVALAYHHAGLTETQHISKAEAMYEAANQLIAINERRQGTGLLIKAACINNLAQIRHGRGDYSYSLEGFKYVGSLFASFGEVLQSSKCEQEVYRGMLMNALLITPPSLAAAA